MNNKIILSSEALKGLHESYHWYEKRLFGLGEIFVGLIDKAFTTIALNPERFPIKGGNYREFVLNKFPYLIIYEFVKEESIVYVLHIFHTKRNPKFKFKQK